MKFEVYDFNTGETIHTFKSLVEARECAANLNAPHLDRMYGIRTR